ncbi:uncharacterized protein LOC131943496 [Physella acuta]|uniref:uncharacterized protein LOC131943496 n=1 Tax=Physella acuta TaxID=109671 RepID=UPI0027DDB52A|nr:uncharacterized protein LOC131943496 [Physella acuta]
MATGQQLQIVFQHPVLVHEFYFHRSTTAQEFPLAIQFHVVSQNGSILFKTSLTFKSDLEMTLTLQMELDEAVSAAVVTLDNDVESAGTICEIEAYGDCYPLYYGLGCEAKCLSDCVDEMCDVNGYCLRCPPEKAGLFCEIDVYTELARDESSKSNYVIAIIIVVIATISIVLWMMIRPRSKHKKKHRSTVPWESDSSHEGSTRRFPPHPAPHEPPPDTPGDSSSSSEDSVRRDSAVDKKIVPAQRQGLVELFDVT